MLQFKIIMEYPEEIVEKLLSATIYIYHIYCYIILFLKAKDINKLVTM